MSSKTSPPSYQSAVFSTGTTNAATAPAIEEVKVEAKDKSSDEASDKTAISNPSSTKSSPTSSIHEVDMEKADPTLEDDEKALAAYLVPTLPKGVKTARQKPASLWIRFRVWYNPYRMVCPDQYSLLLADDAIKLFTFVFTLNMVGIFVACIHHFPYAEHHGAALALGNIVSAVACRNELFLRYLFWVIVKIFAKVRALQPYKSAPLTCSITVDSALDAHLLDRFPATHRRHPLWFCCVWRRVVYIHRRPQFPAPCSQAHS